MAFKLAVAAFSHPMIYASTDERERFVQDEVKKVSAYLVENGFEVFNPRRSEQKVHQKRFFPAF